MLKDASGPLRILKGDEACPNHRYLACPAELYPDDSIEISRYATDPCTIYIKASPKDNGDNKGYLGYFCLHESKLKDASEARHFLLSRAKDWKPKIIITASGYDFEGYVEVCPWFYGFPEIKPANVERVPDLIVKNGVNMFHLPGGVRKAFRMHRRFRLHGLDIGSLTIREAHEIYKAIADFVPKRPKQ